MKNKTLKKLSDHKDEIHRCSKCGICQSACPIYKTTGNECTVSRGQFVMLSGVLKGDLKLNKNINKYLDLCLKCNKCKEVCPSEINPLDIILCAKGEYFNKSISGKIYSFLESKLIFNTSLNITGAILRIFNRKVKSEKFDKKVVYFGGCMSKFNPGVHNYAIKLLNKMGYEVLDIDFNCCGIPFLTTGNIKRFQEQLKENILKLPDSFEYLITDCASCAWAWKEYSKYAEDDVLKEKLSKISFKNIYELIEENRIKFKSKKHVSVTYHKPCHEESTEEIMSIIKSIDNTDFKEMDNYDDCCGLAAFEHLSTINPTSQLRKNKANSIKRINPDVLISSCAGCVASLKTISPKTRVRRLISFLKDYCEIKC